MKKELFISLLTISLGVLMVAPACKKEKTPEPDNFNACDTAGTISYKNQVKPVLESRCGSLGGCHGTGSASGGVVLETYDNVKTYAANGLLLKSIRHESGVSPMPKNQSKMDACRIRLIEKWVSAGYSNN
jgi:hypothetical protein